MYAQLNSKTSLQKVFFYILIPFYHTWVLGYQNLQFSVNPLCRRGDGV